MEERRSELKIVVGALAILACQVLGVDISSVAALIGNNSQEIIDTIKQAHNGEGGLAAAALAGVYALGRSYLKGKVK